MEGAGSFNDSVSITHGILDTRPLLAHCIRVDDDDIETLRVSRARGCALSEVQREVGPWARAAREVSSRRELQVGLGSDSVASNNTCDILEEARFATLLARAGGSDVSASKST